MKEIYFSCDVETNGPIPGVNSMISLGCAAFERDDSPDGGKLIDSWSANLLELPEATRNSDTMEFWSKYPEAYAATLLNARSPANAMAAFEDWVEGTTLYAREKTTQRHVPVFVGYPATFDFMFVYWYLIKFTGHSPFSHAGFDIKTAAAVKLNLPYRQASKRNLPPAWFGEEKHTHVAVEDAIEQGWLFCRMMKGL